MNSISNTNMILRYPGAKWRIADWIIERLPPHKSYLEPFFGSGAVFFKKDPSPIETINDLDEDIVNLFSVVRNDTDSLARAIAATPFSRAEYAHCCTVKATDPVERARIMLVKHWQGFGYRACTPSGWKRDVHGREAAYAMRNWYRLPQWILSVVDRLKEAQIECRPALDLIQEYNHKEVLIYCDPPLCDGYTPREAICKRNVRRGSYSIARSVKQARRPCCSIRI